MKSIAVIALTLFAVSCRNEPAESKPANETVAPVHVTAAAPARRDIERKVVLPATVQAFWDTSVYARVPGYLRELRVDRGDAVRGGETIAVIEAPEIERDRDQMEAEVRAANARAGLADETVRRLRAILKENVHAVTAQELEEAEAKRNVAAADADLARARRAKLASMLNYTIIRAPFDGIVADRFVDRGTLVDAPTSNTASAKPIVRITSVNVVRVFADVPESNVASIHPGTPATVTIDAIPSRSLGGKVTRLESALNLQTRTLRTEVDLDNRDRALRPGMFGQVTFVLDRHPAALMIDATALRSEKSGEKSVFVVRDGKAMKRVVTTGIDDGTSVEITNNLSDSDLVVTKTSQPLTDGVPVVVSKGSS